MAKNKSLDQMSADELFELAQTRQQQEAEKQREAAREELMALREERRALIAAQKKEVAAIDRKIEKLSGKPASKGRGQNISKAVLDILTAQGQQSTKEIKAKLDADGIVANNLSQTLAYLKRKGKITSPQRSVYAMA